jgi:glycosyltransferase involved in cell wall biosynthesis
METVVSGMVGPRRPDGSLGGGVSRLPITVAIPIRNEERNLPECLSRLGRFAQVVVIDSGSTDRSREIASASGAQWVDFRWDGRFPKKRNWYLRNHRVETPWVLFLDADEFVDDAFCDELARTLPGTPHVGFWLNYDNWFLGRRLRHGDANRKLALFRVGAGEYERIEEDRWSHLDMEIHEHPVLSGSVGEIHARIDHRDDRGLEHWRRKHDEYSSWEAHRVMLLRNGQGPSAAELSPRQRRKYASLGKWWLPSAYFVHMYVLKRGFLDGWPGFAYAWEKARYFRDIGQKMRSLERGGR